MQILKCLIIEDELLAADVLRDFIKDTPQLELVDECRNAIDAMEVLRKKDIDVIFVDIELPKLNGIEFVKTILNRYHIIFTTAYHQYAVEGFNVNAVDYLLKPIEFSRFLTAVQKVYERISIVHPSTNTVNTDLNITQKTYSRHLFFNVDKKKIKVAPADISYIESFRDFIYLHLDNSKLVVRYKISSLEQLLPHLHFVRIHKSYIINLNKVTAYGAGYIELSDRQLPIGRSYKSQLQKSLERYRQDK